MHQDSNQTGSQAQRTLSAYGWGEPFQTAFDEIAGPGERPARVIAQHRESYRLILSEEEAEGRISGRNRFAAAPGGFPAVGDWVVIRRNGGDGHAMVLAVLPRKSQFARSEAGRRSRVQVVAANMETVFLVMSLNEDFNPRRLERYLVAAWDSGARPVVVLTKSDLCDDLERLLTETREVACGVPVCSTSGVDLTGIDEVRGFIPPAETVAFLGSSGVGKSTLINVLAGRPLMKTKDIRSDGRGRHTTTHRELIRLPHGGLVVDTPGLRELQVWEGEEGLPQAFDDIETIAEDCRFRDCRHEEEPGCAVKDAIRRGDVSPRRLESHRKLLREMAYQERRRDVGLAQAEKKKWKQIHKEYRRATRARP